MGLGKTILYTGLTGIVLGCGAAALTQGGPAQALKNFQQTVLKPVVENVLPQKAQSTSPAITPTTEETPAKTKTGNTKRHPDFGKSTICKAATNERISLLPIANRSQNFLSSENPTVICRGDPSNSGFFATNPNTVQLTLAPNAQINPDNPTGVWELNFAIMDRDIPGSDGQSTTRKPILTFPVVFGASTAMVISSANQP